MSLSSKFCFTYKHINLFTCSPMEANNEFFSQLKIQCDCFVLLRLSVVRMSTNLMKSKRIGSADSSYVQLTHNLTTSLYPIFASFKTCVAPPSGRSRIFSDARPVQRGRFTIFYRFYPYYRKKTEQHWCNFAETSMQGTNLL